jgi:glycosyltransferase involved in cell wall biosynthesis
VRVGLLIDRWQPRRGGAEGALEGLAQHLAARGDEVLAFARRGPRAEESSVARWHAVEVGGWTRGERERRLAEALLAAADAAGCDVTVGARHLPRVDVLWSHGGAHLETLRARWRAAHGGALAPPDLRPRGRHRMFVALERAALSGGARRIVCPSSLVRDELARLYPHCAPRLVVAPNGVDRARFRPAARGSAGAALRVALGKRGPLLVFAARDPLLKGLPELARALARLLAQPWYLLVAGPRRPRAWARRLAAAGLPRARFEVRADADPVALAAAADLALLPTWRDTSGLVVLEALACGTPVLTTRLAGAAACVTPDAGLVVAHPGDTNALADALSDLLAREAPDRESLARLVPDVAQAMERVARVVDEVAAEKARE